MNSRLAAPRPDIIAVSLVMHLLALALPMALLQIYDRILRRRRSARPPC